MAEHPIILKSEMVRAILEGRKMQMRCPIKGGPNIYHINRLLCDWPLSKFIGFEENIAYFVLQIDVDDDKKFAFKCPWQIGDRLWVRETFLYHCDPFMVDPRVHYKADSSDKRVKNLPDGVIVHNWEHPEKYKWKPSIHMPRWASRITLEIMDIRIERIQEIDTAGLKAEGFATSIEYGPIWYDNFAEFWNFCYGNFNRWEFNPWVWVREFKRIENG